MTQPHTGDFNQQVRVLQIIIAALAAGPLVFAVILLLAIPGEPHDGPLAKIGLLGGLMALAVSSPIGRALRSRAKGSAGVMGAYSVGTIVPAAILEAGVFLNLVCFMQERSIWSLAMAGLLWVALLLRMPTPARVRGWLEREERRLNDEAALGDGR